MRAVGSGSARKVQCFPVQGLFLGLASGATCLAYCSPILVPYFLGEGQAVRRNYLLLGQFLAGRLVGYLLFGLLAGFAGLLVTPQASYRPVIFGCVYILLAVLLALYGLSNASWRCAQEVLWGVLPRVLVRWPAWFPSLAGFLTGLSLCPPFLLVLTEAVGAGGLGGSLLLFFTFFLGTSLYFLPLPFLGTLNRFPALRIVGKLTAVVVALYYLFVGAVTLVGGIGPF